MESFTHATRSRWEDARKRRRVFGHRSTPTRLCGSRTKENSSHRSTPPMDPRTNRASSRPNAPRLTIVNHCRVAALSPSTRRLTDATVRLLVLVRKSDDVTRKYVHRARARVFARAPWRSRSRSSTFALDSACACASHTRRVLAREKKNQAACERRSKGGIGTIRMDDSSGSASTRRVRCGAGDGASRHRRRRRRRDDADDADDRGSRRERGHRVFAANGRSVIHSVGEGAKRKKRIEANARRWLDDSNARRRRSIVAIAWRWKRLVISSAVARVVRTSSPTRLETSRRSPTNVPRRGTLHVTPVITRGCLRTGTFASHDS